LEDQYNFVKALSQRIKSKLVVRLFVPDWGWDQASRWNEKFPEIHLNSGSGSIDTLMSDCRLYIATYNATTFLESLSNNIPTIAFWNPEHWELRDQAKLYFDKLQKAEILFSCPEKAAAKVEEVWDNVDNWWTNAEVQEARLQFCDQYAKKQLHPIKELKKAVCFPF
jgi:putative transferase (TIGR04331 family)